MVSQLEKIKDLIKYIRPDLNGIYSLVKPYADWGDSYVMVARVLLELFITDYWDEIKRIEKLVQDHQEVFGETQAEAITGKLKLKLAVDYLEDALGRQGSQKNE